MPSPVKNEEQQQQAAEQSKRRSPDPERAERRRALLLRKPSKYLKDQLKMQQDKKCDYVVVVYDRDPNAPPPGPKTPPSYVKKRELPVKLSHQVFLQMSFGILRDRLLAHKGLSVDNASGGSKLSPPSPKKDNDDDGDDYFGTATGPSSRASSGRKPAGDAGSSSSSSSSSGGGGANLKDDVVALYLFLGNFMDEMEKSRDQVEREGLAVSIEDAEEKRRLSAAHQPSLNPTAVAAKRPSADTEETTARPSIDPSSLSLPPLEPLATASHVRFQLLLEYGIDVHPLLSAMPKSERAMERYWQETLKPRDVTEEEFYNQMGKPANMGQECSIM